MNNQSNWFKFYVNKKAMLALKINYRISKIDDSV